MNGESVFGWMKALLVLGVVLALGLVAYKLGAKIRAFFGAHPALVNPPKAGADALASALTGRDETFGGALADVFNPSARAANAMLRAPAVPSFPVKDDFVGDLPLDTSTSGFTSNVGGAATGRVFKPVRPMPGQPL